MPIQYMHYLPYGQLLANQRAAGYDERYKFTGKERDAETGYDYFGARYYMPLLYHWTKVDPLVDDYLHISPYAYCNWNPIKYVDPDGRDIKWESKKERKIYRQYKKIVNSRERKAAKEVASINKKLQKNPRNRAALLSNNE